MNLKSLHNIVHLLIADVPEDTQVLVESTGNQAMPLQYYDVIESENGTKTIILSDVDPGAFNNEYNDL